MVARRGTTGLASIKRISGLSGIGVIFDQVIENLKMVILSRSNLLRSHIERSRF